MLAKIFGTAEARQRLTRAKTNLAQVCEEEVARNGGPIEEDDPAYQTANQAVVQAEQQVPYLGRW